MTGKVFLVGAGPGDPGLLTRRGEALLARADVVLYDGLVNAALLDFTRPDCERVYAGKKHSELGPSLSQGQINDLMVTRAGQGKTVVRLKGGDPFVFGRAAEEGQRLAEAGIAFEIVPGVSAATAVPAYAGIPLTARGVASTVAFATGHEAAGKPQSSVDWQGLARADTVVLFMALMTLEDCTRRLIDAGRAADTPAAAIYWGTTAEQQTVVATLGTLAGRVAEAGFKPPVLVIVGGVVALRDALSWYERRPMFGARVLIPRRLEQAAPFAAALAELGAEPVYAPITRLEAPASKQQITRALKRLDTFEWIVLASVNAVDRLFEELVARRLDVRALGLARFACVGPATAEALAARGIIADVVPPQGNASAVAEAVIEAAGGKLREAQVLVPRAAHGREEHIKRLREAGAEVSAVAFYRTVTAAADEPGVVHGLRELRAGRIDALAVFAPSQVTALIELLGDGAVETLNRCRLLAAIGHTTGSAMRRAGVRVDLVPETPRAEALAAAMAAKYKER